MYDFAQFPLLKEWAKSGVEQSWFSTIDYQPPSLAAIQEGLTVVEERKRRKESVYIHCKAGKGRSALVTSCYLVKVLVCDTIAGPCKNPSLAANGQS